MERRQFIQLGLAAAASSMLHRPTFGRVRRTSSVSDEPVMLTIFLRGGNDWLNTVIPYGDPHYMDVRGDLAITPSSAWMLDGSNGLVGINPKMPLLKHHFDDTSSGARRVALMARTGNMTGLRSHFTEQDIVENGLVDHDPREPGWLPKLVHKKEPYMSPNRVMSLARSFNRLYATDGDIPSAHFEEPYGPVDAFGIRGINVNYGGDARRDRLRQAIDDKLAASVGSSDDHSLRQTSKDAIDAVGELGQSLPRFLHDAEFDVLGNDYFLSRLEDAVQMLDKTEARFIGLQIGGFDTHSAQRDSHSNRLRLLDHGIDLAYRNLARRFSNFLILVVSEFGRTVEVNGNKGTDHGVGGGVIALGSHVKGGLYNCHLDHWGMAPHLNKGTKWSPLFESTNEFHSNGGGRPQYRDAIVPTVDFRAHFAEIAKKHLKLADVEIGDVMGPQWQAFAATPVQDFLE